MTRKYIKKNIPYQEIELPMMLIRGMKQRSKLMKNLKVCIVRNHEFAVYYESEGIFRAFKRHFEYFKEDNLRTELYSHVPFSFQPLNDDIHDYFFVSFEMEDVLEYFMHKITDTSTIEFNTKEAYRQVFKSQIEKKLKILQEKFAHVKIYPHF